MTTESLASTSSSSQGTEFNHPDATIAWHNGTAVTRRTPVNRIDLWDL
jgi:hypothetical protein